MGEKSKPSHSFYMLPARPGAGFGFTFAMSTRSPNSLSSGLEGFPDGA